jgi:hypothetical protein
VFLLQVWNQQEDSAITIAIASNDARRNAERKDLRRKNKTDTQQEEDKNIEKLTAEKNKPRNINTK